MAEHYEHAKSWCYCGHLGDGLTSDDPMRRSHHGGLNGHGPDEGLFEISTGTKGVNHEQRACS
jgi:hypothetical protein